MRTVQRVQINCVKAGRWLVDINLHQQEKDVTVNRKAAQELHFEYKPKIFCVVVGVRYAPSCWMVAGRRKSRLFAALKKQGGRLLKSSNNDTEFDDKLFFQVVTESLKKLFICPAKGKYTVHLPDDQTKEDCLQLYRFCRDTVEPLYNMADGQIVQVSSDGKNCQVYIEHENGIQSWFMGDFVYGNPTCGEKVKQGDILCHCKNFDCGIFISPKSLFGE